MRTIVVAFSLAVHSRCSIRLDRRWIAVFVVGLASWLAPCRALGQEDPRERYDQAAREWREAYRDLQRAFDGFYKGTREEADEWRDKWDRALERGDRARDALQAAAIELYRAQPDADAEVQYLITLIHGRLIDVGQYNQAWQLGESILENEPEDQEIIRRMASLAYMLNRFDDALSLLVRFESAGGTLSREERNSFAQLSSLAEAWQQELAIRRQEEQAGDLPRVELVTTRGPIVLELFEDSAPQTVANFIYLVEDGFYDGLTFHRVIEHFMAQGGCPRGDGRGGPGYRIYSEFDRPDARQHFRGVISMANSGRDTEGSQFFITFVPRPELNGRHTVFGRVLSGMDVVGQLTRTRVPGERDEDSIPGAVPDRIVSARVLQKRDHDYQPTRVERAGRSGQ